MSLSDNIFILDKRFNKLIAVGKVKEFIRLLKEACFDESGKGNQTLYYAWDKIDKLAGDELL